MSRESWCASPSKNSRSIVAGIAAFFYKESDSAPFWLVRTWGRNYMFISAFYTCMIGVGWSFTDALFGDRELGQLLFSLPRIFTVMSATVKALLLSWFLYWGRDGDEACGRWLCCVSFGLFGAKGNVGILRAWNYL